MLKKFWFLTALFLVILFTFTMSGLSSRISSIIYIPLLVFMVMFLMSFTMEKAQTEYFKRLPRGIFFGVIAGYTVVPFLGYIGTKFFLNNFPQYGIGLIIMVAMPCTLVSATIWTRIAGGNDLLSLLITITSNFLTFLVTPGILYVILATRVSIPVNIMIARLILIIVVPVIIGQVLRNIGFMGSLSPRIKPVVSKFCQVLILLMVFKGCAGAVTPMLTSISVSGMGQLLWLCLAILFIHVISLVLVHGLSGVLKFREKERVALLFAGTQKTLPEALYVATTFFPSLHLATVPIILFHAFQLVIDTVVVEKILLGKRNG